MQTIRLDIVSDVVCPWCAIGYKRLEQAMAALADEFSFQIEWHPFELNPDMPPEGEPVSEHIQRKYGLSEQAQVENRERIAAIAKGLGLDFYEGAERRIYNTFDAHRLLYWAREQGRQTELELALFNEYFSANNDPSAMEVLRRAAEAVGLDGGEAEMIVGSGRYAEEVRAEQRQFQAAGISAVPAFIVNGKYLISGGQEPATFINAFRQIAAESDRPR